MGVINQDLECQHILQRRSSRGLGIGREESTDSRLDIFITDTEGEGRPNGRQCVHDVEGRLSIERDGDVSQRQQGVFPGALVDADLLSFQDNGNSVVFLVVPDNLVPRVQAVINRLAADVALHPSHQRVVRVQDGVAVLADNLRDDALDPGKLFQRINALQPQMVG